MRASAVTGIVFANSEDGMLKAFTENRSMGSVPFGARYRLIDFPLSSLANAGIIDVGIITKENYRSLMEHVGSGKHWDLDRKNGGLDILPPYFESGMKKYKGTVDALYGAKYYIEQKKSEYVVICPSNVVASIDIASALEAHISSEADVTIIYHKNDVISDKETVTLSMENERINSMGIGLKKDKNTPYALGITIISRKLLIELIVEAEENGFLNFHRDVLSSKTGKLKIMGFEHKGFAMIMNDTDMYFKANMALLNSEKRHQLFDTSRPVYTKNRDDMPTRYGINSDVKGSIIADGCVINGKVRNSIIFRGVTVEEGACVENSILMQESFVGASAKVCGAVVDKDCCVAEGMSVKGTEEKHIFIQKNQVI